MVKVSGSISKHAIPGGSWIVAQGSREEVFKALGEEGREPIRDLLAHDKRLGDLRQRVADSKDLAQHYDAVATESRLSFPKIWSELRHLASGAGVAFEDLLLLNLSPDLGGLNGTGCTNMAWAGASSTLLAHNEDGPTWFLGRCPLVTLRIEEEPAVTGWWYPGYLPGDFGFNEHGLCWGIDNINVNVPAVAPGRYFVSRSLQSAADVETFLNTLRNSPCAGGWAYTVGSMRSTEAAVVEAAAGSVAVRPVTIGSSDCVWQTNHLRMLDSVPDTGTIESSARADRLSDLSMPAHLDSAWMFRLFSEDPVIGGIRSNGAHFKATLATVQYDLGTGEIVLKIGNGRPIGIPWNQPDFGEPVYELLEVGAHQPA